MGLPPPLLWTQMRTKPTVGTRQISPAHCIGLPPGDTLCLLGIFSVVVCDEFCYCVPMTCNMHLHRMSETLNCWLLVVTVNTAHAQLNFMWVVVAGAYPLRSAQLLVEVEYVHQLRREPSMQCEESRVGSAPASSSVRKCECKRH